MDRWIEKKYWTRRRITFVVISGIIAVLVLYSVLLGNRRSTVNVETDHLVISMVERRVFQEYIPVTGTVLPVKTHFLDAVEGGLVDTVYLEAGSYVETGDNILKLSNTNLVMDIMHREAELFQQSNNLRNTRLNMEQHSLEMQRRLLDLTHDITKQRRIVSNNTRLADKNLISIQEFEESKEEFKYLVSKLDLTMKTHCQDSLFRIIQIEQLEASLERMNANLEIVKKNMDNLVIEAPVSGHLTSLNTEIGQSISRGERLGQIDILDGFKVNVEIDEHYIGRVNAGLQGTATVAGEEYGLDVIKVYPEVINGRFTIDMAFGDSEPSGIRRGQSLRIRLQLGELSEAVLIPTGGFFRETAGRWIYVVDTSKSFAEKREIHLGRENPHYYEVIGGLNSGELVITSSYDNFGNADQLVLK